MNCYELVNFCFTTSCLIFILLLLHSVTHSKRVRDPLLGCDPPVEKCCSRVFSRMLYAVCVCFRSGITVLLSLTVFMLMVAEIMPATSDSVPLIGQSFLLLLQLRLIFNTVWTVTLLSQKLSSFPPIHLLLHCRPVLCQHHGDRRDVCRGDSLRALLQPSRPQQRGHAQMGE